jgi:predicted transcriptional regulator
LERGLEVAEPARKLTISIVAREDIARHSRESLRNAIAVAEAGREEEHRSLVFATHELFSKRLSVKRLDLMQVMLRAGPMSIRELARRAGRDIKAVHGDVQALIEAGLIEKTDTGQIVFPYDEVHLDIVLRPLEADAAA